MGPYGGATWTTEMPLWVSRKTADGIIYKATVPMWLFMVIFLTVLANLVAWPIIGIAEIVQYVL